MHTVCGQLETTWEQGIWSKAQIKRIANSRAETHLSGGVLQSHFKFVFPLITIARQSWEGDKGRGQREGKEWMGRGSPMTHVTRRPG